MKTKKEIKPFWMRVNPNEGINIESILKESGIELIGFHKLLEKEDELFIEMQDECSVVYYSDSFLDKELFPELTYSEFMKLYGEEEEVFTREDMKDFVWECLLNECNTRGDVDQQLTIFLSERTND